MNFQKLLDSMEIKIITWDQLFSKYRTSVSFVYCGNGDHFYRPKEWKYEDYCPICNKTQKGGATSEVIVIMERLQA